MIALVALKRFISSSGDGNMDTGFFLEICVSMFYVIEICIVSDMIAEPKPTSMDVYQGKTTLKYEVIDGEIVDSCVVWKEEK